VFASADRVIALDTLYPSSHPAPLETSGALVGAGHGAGYDIAGGAATA
jgi:hypothetical protein